MVEMKFTLSTDYTRDHIRNRFVTQTSEFIYDSLPHEVLTKIFYPIKAEPRLNWDTLGILQGGGHGSETRILTAF